jgi:hypothetical protein
MKEMFKTHILQDKFSRDDEFKKTLRDENKKERRLKKDLETAETSIASIETDKLLKRMEAGVYRRVRKNLTEELERIRSDLEQTRLRIQELGNQKRWIDWITAHQKDIENMSDMNKETQKGYLEGILDTITVKFKHPIVGDSHKWNNPKRKSEGYIIVDGSTDMTVNDRFTKRGGAPVKKKTKINGNSETVTPTLENAVSP